MQTLEKPRRPAASPARKPVNADVPHWDAGENDLFFRGRLVWHFVHDARDQAAILAAFQAQAWPRFIVVKRVPKLRTWTKRRLHDTVQNLNRSVRRHLHFRQQRSSELIRWQPGRRKSR